MISNLCYYNYRYISNEFGRWIHRDLMDSGRDRNEYVYIGNNSCNSFDMLGLMRPSDFYYFSEKKKRRWVEDFWREFGLHILQSARRHCVPYRLLAGVIANEQLDYSWIENVLEHLGFGKSLGPAQITISTAVMEGLIEVTPDSFNDAVVFGFAGEMAYISKYDYYYSFVRAQLLSAENNIDIAARLLKKYLTSLCRANDNGSISASFLRDILGGERLSSHSLNNFCCQYKKGNCNPQIDGTLSNATAAIWNNSRGIIYSNDIGDTSKNA